MSQVHVVRSRHGIHSSRHWNRSGRTFGGGENLGKCATVDELARPDLRLAALILSVSRGYEKGPLPGNKRSACVNTPSIRSSIDARYPVPPSRQSCKDADKDVSNGPADTTPDRLSVL